MMTSFVWLPAKFFTWFNSGSAFFQNCFFQVPFFSSMLKPLEHQHWEFCGIVYNFLFSSPHCTELKNSHYDVAATMIKVTRLIMDEPMKLKES